MIEKLLKRSSKIALVDDKFGEISYSSLKSENLSGLLKQNSLSYLFQITNEFIKDILVF